MHRLLAAFILSFLLTGKELPAQQQGQGGENALQLSLAALSASSSSVEDATLTGNGRRIAGSTDENGTCTLRMLDSSGYQPINGTQVPFEIQQYRNHALSLDLQVENAVLNMNIAASLFNLQ